MKNKEQKMSVYARMSEIKKELSVFKIPKSGHNRYAGFTYHELQDFMPIINRLNAKYGVSVFSQFLREKGICTLKVINTDDSTDQYTVVIPFVEAEMLAKGGAPSNVDKIQRMGSTLTYNRRYLFMCAYDIVENDSIDQQPVEPNKQPKPQPKPQPQSKLKVDMEKAILAIKDGKATVEDIVASREVTVEELAVLNEISNNIKKK